jgi:glutamate racemase
MTRYQGSDKPIKPYESRLPQDTTLKGDPRDRLSHGQSALQTYTSNDDTVAKNRSYAPIGVFDSGAGGLTILSVLRQELPYENYIYLGDTGHCPYGTRSEAEIIDLSVKANRFLVEQGVKLIVVACNTASQAALSTLRATFPIPFVGVVPAVKPAARATQRKRIGVAATNRSVQTDYLRQLINTFAEGIEVYSVGCPELVTLVEEGQLDGPHVEAELQRALEPLLLQDIDVLVLGCTHFPALRSAIERVVGPGVQVIDSGEAIARRTRAVLEAEHLLYPVDLTNLTMGSLEVWCSGDARSFSSVASAVLGYPVEATSIGL